MAGGDTCLFMGLTGFSEPAHVGDEDRLPDSLLKSAGLLGTRYSCRKVRNLDILLD